MCPGVQKLEEQVDHLHGVIASMRSQNLRLTWALTASQSEVVSNVSWEVHLMCLSRVGCLSPSSPSSPWNTLGNALGVVGVAGVVGRC